MKRQQQQIHHLQTQQQLTQKTAAQLYLQSLINAPYNPKNAYSNSKSIPQILTIIIFIVQVTLHSVFIAPKIYTINNEILNFFFILNYFIMVGVVGHYVYLTCSDPVDSLIVDVKQRETVEKNSKQETVFCIMCQKTVKKTSKHCYYCGRCTEQYDHHCSCLNNCIGLGNYQQFIRLLLFYQVFNSLTTLQAIWVIIKAENSDDGALIFLVIVCMSIFILIVLLLVFHCYLNCLIKKPTYQFWKDRKHIKYQIGDKVQYKNYIGEILKLTIKDQKFPGIDFTKPHTPRMINQKQMKQ